MQRIIKFRAWDENIKCFSFYGHRRKLVVDLNGQCHDLEFGNQGGFVLQQFTGLLDKNGNEIYEGDICSARDKASGEVINGKIKWSTYTDEEYVEHLECWMFEGKRRLIFEDGDEVVKAPLSCICKSNGVRYCRGLETEENSILVIGNIFETPELLK